MNKLVTTLLLLGISFVSHSQDIWESWNSAILRFDVAKDIEANVEFAGRFDLTENVLNQSFVDLSIGYDGIKWLEPALFTRYSTDFDVRKRWRFGGLVDFPFDINKRITITPRVRYEINEKRNGNEQRLRLRLKPSWSKKKWKHFVSVEAFLPEFGSAEKLRYALGSSYDFLKKHRISLKLAYEELADEEELDVGIIALDYRYNF